VPHGIFQFQGRSANRTDMPSRITRRDFLNGVALSIAAGLTPAAQAAAPYPPALTGLRGHHPGSFEVAHRFREGENFAIDGLAAD
jgi:spermidine dehydrogenase